MSKISVKSKAVGLLLGLAVALLAAPNLNAQDSGNRGLLGRGTASDDKSVYHLGGLLRQNPDTDNGYNLYNQQFGSDENGGYELYNQTFGQEVPFGSGLFIMAVAGVSYALKKRKKEQQ